jgi:hypothetical protein
MLTRQWDDEAWPLVRHEVQKALTLRSLLRKAGWWNEAIPRYTASRSRPSITEPYASSTCSVGSSHVTRRRWT